MNAPCRFLDWDSRFFGCRIGRIEGHRLREEAVPAILDWCAAEKIGCLYFLAESDCPETIRVAEAHGFGMKDLRITYGWRASTGALRPQAQLPDAVRIRSCRAEDVAALEAIAGSSHTDTRFYFDQRFPRALAAQMYQVWIRQSGEGRANIVLVLECEGEACGYLACHLESDGTGRVGLVGLGEKVRGRGLAQAMLHAGLCWFVEQGVTTVSVATQGHNVDAQRLYQRAGFLMQSLQLWYHKWFELGPPPARDV